MNKGFKNYTKRITQAVGNVAEVSVNVNKTDSNIHIIKMNLSLNLNPFLRKK